jgi:hypothetical protein
MARWPAALSSDEGCGRGFSRRAVVFCDIYRNF